MYSNLITIYYVKYQSSESYTLYHLHRLRTPHQEIVDWSQRVFCTLEK